MRLLLAALALLPGLAHAQERSPFRWRVGLVGTGAISGRIGGIGAGVVANRSALRVRSVDFAIDAQAVTMDNYDPGVCTIGGEECAGPFRWARILATIGVSARLVPVDPGAYVLVGSGLYYPWWDVSSQRDRTRWETGPARPLLWIGFGGLGRTEWMEIRLTHTPSLAQRRASWASLAIGARF